MLRRQNGYYTFGKTLSFKIEALAVEIPGPHEQEILPENPGRKLLQGIFGASKIEKNMQSWKKRPMLTPPVSREPA